MSLEDITINSNHVITVECKRCDWIKVKDKLPNGQLQYQYVLTLDEYNTFRLLYYLKDEDRWYTGDGIDFEVEFIMYWMPLPEPPKDQ